MLLSGPVAAQGIPEGTKTLQLSKVILDTETSEATARVKGGTLCVFPSTVTLPKEKKTQDYERFDNLFTGRMKSAGFTVVSTSSNMFASEDDKNKADYMIGVTLRPVSMNLCSSVNGYKCDYSVKAEWQIYDRADGKTVETLTTTGRGEQAKFAMNGLDQMLNAAFTAHLAALVETGVMQKYVQPTVAQ
ncbi:hypothetical protein ACFQRC_12895 [Enterovirga sp. GCM10030262]|uniref:hypothetical protein n=1 Tax=Enterovirga sp. GCM10030262 TaxID=3273391 RepID=UPI00360EC458